MRGASERCAQGRHTARPRTSPRLALAGRRHRAGTPGRPSASSSSRRAYVAASGRCRNAINACGSTVPRLWGSCLVIDRRSRHIIEVGPGGTKATARDTASRRSPHGQAEPQRPMARRPGRPCDIPERPIIRKAFEKHSVIIMWRLAWPATVMGHRWGTGRPSGARAWGVAADAPYDNAEKGAIPVESKRRPRGVMGGSNVSLFCTSFFNF